MKLRWDAVLRIMTPVSLMAGAGMYLANLVVKINSLHAHLLRN